MAKMGKKKGKQEFVIPSNPADRKKIENAIKEIVNHMVMIQSQKDSIKDVMAMLKDDYALPRKDANKMAKTLFKGEYSKVVQQADHFQELYTSIIGEPK